jgi:hypothetical protein
MGGKRLQFIIYVPRGMRVADINHIEHIHVDVLEDHKRIDRLTLEGARRKYG